MFRSDRGTHWPPGTKNARLGWVLIALFALSPPARAAVYSNQTTLSLLGQPEIVFDSARGGCDSNDVPDINPRAFRDGDGTIVFFALHYINRAFRGRDLAHLKLDCHVALGSGLDPDPSHYNDRNYITATWTANGKTAAALVHQEYHADDYGRCQVNSALGCWYNTILAYQSANGGEDFVKAKPLVVAAAPFTQDVAQGRQRGFFNPSNIFSDGTYEYFFASTTGWQGQPNGACLFRSANPLDSGSWRSFDGAAFTIHYVDPYRSSVPSPKACAPIAPFPLPVGAVVRQRNTGVWIAVYEAVRNEDGAYPVDGFYYATARDLFHWSTPRLLHAGATSFSDLCAAGSSIIAYPSVLDDHAKTRNFDDVGNQAYLYFTVIKGDNCASGERLLMRQRISIATGGKAAAP